MWSVATEDIRGGWRLRIQKSGSTIPFSELFSRLEHDDSFISWYTRLLNDAPFDAFFWEHPPVTAGKFDDAAEFVLLDGPSLASLPADPEPFRSQFERQRDQSVATFRNLGGDAVLVAPLPEARLVAYAHLAAFLRNAPEPQVSQLWRQTARAIRENICEKPMWISTAGMGVAWLHMRLDSRPKYYRFGPYRDVRKGPDSPGGAR